MVCFNRLCRFITDNTGADMPIPAWKLHLRTRLSAGYKTKERHTDLFLLFLVTAGIRFFQKRVICDNSSPATDSFIQGGVFRHPAIVQGSSVSGRNDA